MDEILYESMSDLNDLAVKILKKYDVSPQNITIVQSGGIKAVWKITTPNDTLCLKRLRQAYDKVLFTVNAQVYINRAGGNVPKVILNNNNEPIVQYNNQLFVLYEWLEGKDLYFNDSADLKAAIKGLAAFHIYSKGYIPPKNSTESSKFGDWPEQYYSMKRRFENWKTFKLDDKLSRSYSAFLNHVNSMVEAADTALDILEKSEYRNLTTPNSKHKVLCHQDFGQGNVISTEKGIIVLDLDSVTFDLPIRDLRKIIGKLSEKSGVLNINTLNTVLSWYSSVNPLSDEEKRILCIDLSFPHWFHGQVKDIFLKGKFITPSKIEEVAEFEKAKNLMIKKLLG